MSLLEYCSNGTKIIIKSSINSLCVELLEATHLHVTHGDSRWFIMSISKCRQVIMCCGQLSLYVCQGAHVICLPLDVCHCLRQGFSNNSETSLSATPLGPADLRHIPAFTKERVNKWQVLLTYCLYKTITVDLVVAIAGAQEQGLRVDHSDACLRGESLQFAVISRKGRKPSYTQSLKWAVVDGCCVLRSVKHCPSNLVCKVQDISA